MDADAVTPYKSSPSVHRNVARRIYKVTMGNRQNGCRPCMVSPAPNVPIRPGRPTGPGGDCSPGRPGQLNSGRRLTASIIREDGRPRG